jgi:hypothetical protein
MAGSHGHELGQLGTRKFRFAWLDRESTNPRQVSKRIREALQARHKWGVAGVAT